VNYAWDSWIILMLIGFSIVMYCLFVIQEWRHPEPILNLRTFRIHNFAVICVIVMFYGVAMLAGFSFLPLYFQYVRHDSAMISGLKMVPMVIGLMISSISTGLFIAKTGKFIVFPTIGLGLVILGLGLISLMNETMSYSIEWIFLFVMGIGMGLGSPVFNSIVQNSVPPKDMASSMSGVGFLRSLGGSIGVAVYGSILNQLTTKFLTQGYSPEGAQLKALQKVYVYAMIPAAVSFIFTFFIKNVDIFARKPRASSAAVTDQGKPKNVETAINVETAKNAETQKNP